MILTLKLVFSEERNREERMRVFEGDTRFVSEREQNDMDDCG